MKSEDKGNMMKTTFDLSKIDYKIRDIGIWDDFNAFIKSNNGNIFSTYGSNFQINDYCFTRLVIKSDKKELIYTWMNSDRVSYNYGMDLGNQGAKTLFIKIDLQSLIKNNILDNKEKIFIILRTIIFQHHIPCTIVYPTTRDIFGYEQRVAISDLDIVKNTLCSLLGEDLNINIKLHFDLPINYQDIGSCSNLEIRERLLRKYGYENYIKEGLKKEDIIYIIYDNDTESKTTYLSRDQMLSRFMWEQKYNKNSDKIIEMAKGISFLQVKDSSTEKTYFLKIPPEINNITEAKAWTFGLTKKEYKLTMEA